MNTLIDIFDEINTSYLAKHFDKENNKTIQIKKCKLSFTIAYKKRFIIASSLLILISVLTAAIIISEQYKKSNNHINNNKNDVSMTIAPKQNLVYGDIELSLIDKELYIAPPDDGTVRINENLRILFDSNEDPDTIYAMLCFPSSFSYNKTMNNIEASLIEALNLSLEECYEHQDKTGHIIENNECNICVELNSKFQKADDSLQAFRDSLIDDDGLNLMLAKSIHDNGLNFVIKKLVWKSEYYEEFIIVYAKRNDIINFNCPMDLGIIFDIAPSWMDTDDDYIEREPTIRIE